MATNTSNIKSIVKAGKVIDMLAAAEQPMALADMARETGMVKSTLHGIVSTLVDIGYLKQMPESGHYTLGMRLFEIGYSIPRKLDERRIAYPYMQRIVEQTGETAHMAILSDGEVLYLDKLESSSSIRIVTDAGVRLPVHSSGLGKVLLSGLSDEAARLVIKKKGLARHTEHTITDWDALLDELRKIRRCGYAVDEQEYLIGLRCVAAPIKNHRGEVTTALSIAGPVSRMQGDAFKKNKKILLDASAAISRELGYGV